MKCLLQRTTYHLLLSGITSLGMNHISSIKRPAVYFFLQPNLPGVYWRPELIRGRRLFSHVYTNFASAPAPFDTQSVNAHRIVRSYALGRHYASAPDGKAKISQAPDGEAESAGSHYMH